MFKKLLLSSMLILTSLYSQNLTNEKFQILANNIETQDNLIIAKGNVVIFSPDYYISAQKVFYDKSKSVLELFDDVIILKNNRVQTQSSYAFFDLNTENITQNPIFILEKSSNLWITSKDATKTTDIYALNNSIMSSCDCIDPAWNIRFSEGEYDVEDQWIHTYNTRLYIKDIPVLYTPYFGFSTNKKRRTGLLMPTIGYSGTEGLLYSQPMFIAPEADYDVELVPQVRTNRGYGMYAYFRYADSQYSNLSIGTGFFEEKSEYVDANSLKNKKHFGWNIDYIRRKLFAKNEDEDGLYASIDWLNDIEYKNLEDRDNDTEQKIESKINYYYKTPEYYFGTYLRHYLDTTLDSNDTTLQELPQVQVHSFSKPIFTDKLLYSSDVKVTNYVREEGLNATRYELFVPFSYSFSFFDDYLKVTLEEELSIVQTNYSKGTQNFDDSTFVESRHIININSDLIKAYEKGLHTLNLSTEIVIPETIEEKGDIYTLTNSATELSPFPQSETTKTLSFAINQSWNDIESLKEIINHKMSQSVIYNNLDESELGNLENEIRYNYLLGTVYNKLLFSNQDNQLIESSSSFSLDYLNYFLKLNHYMSKDTPNSGKEELESYTVDTGFTFYNDYTISYYENYNLKEDLRSKQSLIFGINDKCWNVNFKLEKEITAAATTSASATKQDIIYIELILKPIGAIRQQYNVKGN